MAEKEAKPVKESKKDRSENRGAVRGRCVSSLTLGRDFKLVVFDDESIPGQTGRVLAG